MWEATAFALLAPPGPGGRRGRALDPLHRAADRAVVEQAQVVVAVLARAARWPRRRRPCRGRGARARGRCARARATRAARRSARRAGPGCPRATHLLAPASRPRRAPVAGQQRSLAVDHDAAAGLVDVGGLADQPGVLAAPGPRGGPDMITTSTPARWQASSARACGSEKFPSASRNSEPPRARAGSRRGRCRRSAGPRRATVHGSAALR